MPSRFEYERAVRSSGLPPMSRLLALTIATWADIRTGVIPHRLMPSLSKLEESTGMARGSVRTHLDRLEDNDWLIRNRPPVAAARAEKARTQYRLRIPKGIAVPDTEASELGQELHPAGADAAPDDQRLGQELPQARAGAALELGQELTPSRAGAALSSSFSDLSTTEYQRGGDREQGTQPAAPPARRQPHSPAPIDDDGFTLTDPMRAWALRTFGPHINLDYETAQFRDHFRANGQRRNNWAAEWQKWIRRSAKFASERATRGNVVQLPTGQTLTGTDAKVAGWLALANELEQDPR